MKEAIRLSLKNVGATAVGFAKAGEPDASVMALYENWISGANHGEMAYLERHLPLKRNTDSVLPGAKTVISLAFSYVPSACDGGKTSKVAAYAYGDDYHQAIRQRLKQPLKELKERYGGIWRVCIDSAPLLERFWALKSGIGKRGLNGNIIVEGCGSYCFLAEILTTLEIEPDIASDGWCDGCNACIKKCPGKAIKGDGTIDARRCINYLSIEKKSELSFEERKILSEGNSPIYGCDICLKVCPHNQNLSPTDLREFHLREEIKDISKEELLTISEEEFKSRFQRSPLLYAGLKKLQALHQS